MECSLNDYRSCRPTVARLAKLTKGRCLSVDYRLAPQHPFPAALLDLFLVFLNLIYPPRGSCHEAVSSDSIILAGDSAGASLCLALVQVLLRLHDPQFSTGASVKFNGQVVRVPMPAGVAVLSPVGDLMASFPSWTQNAEHDILQDKSPLPHLPADTLWPMQPPRANPYCDDHLLSHPLVALATVQDWTGAPPIWIACGEERLADSAMVIAKAAHEQGVVVRWEQYLSMPHTWAQLFPGWSQSERCFESWANACVAFADGTGRLGGSTGKLIENDGSRVVSVALETLTTISPQEALEQIEISCTAFRASMRMVEPIKAKL